MRDHLDRPEDPGGVAISRAVAVKFVELEFDGLLELQVLLVEAPRLPGRALGPAPHRARTQPLRARHRGRRHPFHDELHGLVEVPPRTTHAIVGRSARGDKGPAAASAQVANPDSTARGQACMADHAGAARGVGAAIGMGTAGTERAGRLHPVQSPRPVPIRGQAAPDEGAAWRAPSRCSPRPSAAATHTCRSFGQARGDGPEDQARADAPFSGIGVEARARDSSDGSPDPVHLHSASPIVCWRANAQPRTLRSCWVDPDFVYHPGVCTAEACPEAAT